MTSLTWYERYNSINKLLFYYKCIVFFQSKFHFHRCFDETLYESFKQICNIYSVGFKSIIITLKKKKKKIL